MGWDKTGVELDLTIIFYKNEPRSGNGECNLVVCDETATKQVFYVAESDNISSSMHI